MPLTQENKALIPSQVYNSFNQRLASVAASNKQIFANFNGTAFDTSDFLDSAHLNAKGANKLVGLLGPQIDSALLTAKNSHE
jgi:hypothetical protein